MVRDPFNTWAIMSASAYVWARDITRAAHGPRFSDENDLGRNQQWHVRRDDRLGESSSQADLAEKMTSFSPEFGAGRQEHDNDWFGSSAKVLSELKAVESAYADEYIKRIGRLWAIVALRSFSFMDIVDWGMKSTWFLRYRKILNGYRRRKGS
jgi:hypothetical protein